MVTPILGRIGFRAWRGRNRAPQGRVCVGQFFDSNPADRAPSGAKEGRWRKDLPRNWRVALDLPGEEPYETLDQPGADSGYRLGPEHGTLSLRTGRNGAAAKAGHDLLIHATRWQATLVVGDDAAGSSLALDIDGGSMRVIEGTTRSAEGINSSYDPTLNLLSVAFFHDARLLSIASLRRV